MSLSWTSVGLLIRNAMQESNIKLLLKVVSWDITYLFDSQKFIEVQDIYNTKHEEPSNQVSYLTESNEISVLLLPYQR